MGSQLPPASARLAQRLSCRLTAAATRAIVSAALPTKSAVSLLVPAVPFIANSQPRKFELG